MANYLTWQAWYGTPIGRLAFLALSLVLAFVLAGELVLMPAAQRMACRRGESSWIAALPIFHGLAIRWHLIRA